jgi:hypothetical protein
MSEDEKNFDHWFKKTLKFLYKKPGAGFAILMISLPLLERYLRQKTGLYDKSLSPKFYRALEDLFPALRIPRFPKAAEGFWTIYRDGLLHQAALTLRWKKTQLGVKNDLAVEIQCHEVKSGLSIMVSPELFARKVVSTIKADFSTYLGQGSKHHPLPKVH